MLVNGFPSDASWSRKCTPWYPGTSREPQQVPDIMLRPLLSSIFVLGLVLSVRAQTEHPPNELISYVREARKAGVAESKIQQNAVKAGWPEATVKQALAATRGDSSGAPAAPTTIAVPSKDGEKPAAIQPAPIQQPGPAQPVAAPNAATLQSVRPASTNGPAEPATKPGRPDRGVPDDYVIGEGDVLHVSVWKEPDASVPSVVVRPDGKITLPMIKDLQISGLTPAQAEKLITEQLARFISAADVTVIVSGINSKRIYVVGGVKKEGPIPYTYRMTVLQALSEAGGLTDYAKKKKIYVLRRENGRDYQLPFDYNAVLKGERMELNIPLLPGDTIVVPK